MLYCAGWLILKTDQDDQRRECKNNMRLSLWLTRHGIAELEI